MLKKGGMRLRNKRIVVLSVLLIFTAALALNVEVSIRQGIDGREREIRMPLYVKMTEFLARHFEYSRIAREITKGCSTDEEKVLALFNWTHENIREVPEGMPVVDDHILNIIIRGYGMADQSQDVFTTLCAYSHISAFWALVHDTAQRVRYPLSFVRLNGKWRVFDAYRKVYFRTRDGDIASVEDLMRDPSLVEGKGADGIEIGGVPYKELFHSLRPVREGRMLRAQKQMPCARLLFEVKKLCGATAETRDENEL
jgi:hypothetical protein